MKRILKYLFVITLFMTLKCNVYASNFSIWHGSCGDEDHAYEFYKIFDKIGDGETVAYQYQVTDKWKDFFLLEVSEDFAILDENGIVTKFGPNQYIENVAVEALKYAKDNSIAYDLKPVIACSPEDIVKFEIEEGYYLIKSPRGSLGTIVDIPNVSEINEKNMDPMIILYYGDLVTNNLTYASIGDEVIYNAELIIREGTNKAYFEIIGNPGITIDPESIQIVNNEFDPSYMKDFVFRTTNLKDENAVVGLEFPEECLAKMTSTARLMIRFTGKVNENVLFSNNDSIKVNDIGINLYYGDDQDITANISLISWKYTINTFYTDNSNQIDIPNVHYSLSKTNDTENPELFNFVKLSDGVYRLAHDGDRDTTTDLVNTEGKSIIIEGLNIGTYYLIQESRPVGFAKVYDPATIKLEIADGSKGRKLKVDTLNIELAKESFILPMTGGTGTTLLITFSLIIFVLTLCLIITKIRIKNN